MRSNAALIAIVLASIVGCARSGGPPGEPGPDVISRLKWPRTPTEHRTRNNAGNLTIHNADYMVSGPNGPTMYSASIIWDDKHTDPKEWLSDLKKAYAKDGKSCQEIEFGPEKYPGLDTTTEPNTQQAKVYTRQLDVLVRSTSYSISVIAPNAELLDDPDVRAFFDSFTLNE
jgi:hypothetical protein